MPRKPKKTRGRRAQIPATITDEYRNHLIYKDFMGELGPDEVKIARKLGIYRWDGFIKRRNENMKTLSHH